MCFSLNKKDSAFYSGNLGSVFATSFQWSSKSVNVPGLQLAEIIVIQDLSKKPHPAQNLMTQGINLGTHYNFLRG